MGQTAKLPGTGAEEKEWGEKGRRREDGHRFRCTSGSWKGDTSYDLAFRLGVRTESENSVVGMVWWRNQSWVKKEPGSEDWKEDTAV